MKTHHPAGLDVRKLFCTLLQHPFNQSQQEFVFHHPKSAHNDALSSMMKPHENGFWLKDEHCTRKTYTYNLLLINTFNTITFAIGIDISFFLQISVLFSSQNHYKILVSFIQEKPQAYMMNNVIKHWMAFVYGVS